MTLLIIVIGLQKTWETFEKEEVINDKLTIFQEMRNCEEMMEKSLKMVT